MNKNKAQDISEIINNSGNRLHSEVVSKLRRLKWEVKISPYYSDNYTGKPREIDIIAKKEFPIKNVLENCFGMLSVHLFVECKYINKNTVFWFDDIDLVNTEELIEKNFGLKKNDVSFDIKSHHYYKDYQVAKLWASESNKNEDNELIGKAINQVLNGSIYYRNHNKTTKNLSYPIIIVNSSASEYLYETDIEDKSGRTDKINKPFMLEVNYAYTNKNHDNVSEYFLIDVIRIDEIDNFITHTLEAEEIPTILRKIAFQEDWKQVERESNNSKQRKEFL